MDAYLKPTAETDATGVPLNLKTKPFLKNLQRNLTAAGLIVFTLNAGATTKNDIESIRQVYPHSYIFAAPKADNVIVLVNLSPDRRKTADLARAARSLDREFRANFSFRKIVRTLKR